MRRQPYPPKKVLIEDGNNCMKNNSLEGLRGIAALGVILSHMLFSMFPYLTKNMVPLADLPQAYAWETIAMLPPVMVFFNGSFAVSIFFVLSGYVLTKNFSAVGDRRILISAALKRYPRLVIPTLVSVLFAWALLSLGAMNTDLIPVLGSAGWPFEQYSQQATVLQAIWAGFIGAPLIGDNSLNAPLWTIRIELLGSLMMFVAYYLAGPKNLILAFLYFLPLAFLVSSGNISIIHYIAIFSGSLLNRIDVSAKISAGVIVIGMVLGGFDYSVYYSWVPRMWDQEKLVVQSLGAVLLVGGTLHNKTFSQLLQTTVPVFLGKISFSSYLLHWPIICSFGFGMIYLLKVKLGFGHMPTSIAVLAITLPLIFAASYAFERLIDGHATRLASKWANLVLLRNRRTP